MTDPDYTQPRVASSDDWSEAPTEVGEGRVDPDAAYAFALATNDPNEVYLRGEAVPPMFSAAQIRLASNRSEQLRAAGNPVIGTRAVVHGEHDAYFHAPVRPGDRLRWQARTYSVRQSPAGLVSTQRIVVTNEAGQLAVEHFWTVIYVGAQSAGAGGPDLSDHSFPAEARMRPLGEHTFALARDQAYRYAGVSGDHNGHSVDSEAARAEGFDGRILQGLCTLAMCSGAVIKVALAGDPGSLRRFACRMAAPVPAGAELTVQVYDAGPSPIGRAVAF